MPKETKISTNVECFCKIEIGSNDQTTRKAHFKDGSIIFNETMDIKINSEKSFKILFWYTENDNSFILIGNGLMNFLEVDQIEKETVEKQLKITNGEKEQGTCEIKLQLH